MHGVHIVRLSLDKFTSGVEILRKTFLNAKFTVIGRVSALNVFVVDRNKTDTSAIGTGNWM